jgi:hypothetical protein
LGFLWSLEFGFWNFPSPPAMNDLRFANCGSRRGRVQAPVGKKSSVTFLRLPSIPKQMNRSNWKWRIDPLVDPLEALRYE